jgi:hypothetical protein
MLKNTPIGDLETRVRVAVTHYWTTRRSQSRSQAVRGVTDQGARSAVTGGKQMDGFVEIIRDLLVQSSIPDGEIFHSSKLELPGYYRPEKQWDIVVVSQGRLVAAIEFKSQASSFGNNFNNRVEESVGSATDLWTAYREGAVPMTPKPWLGYFMFLVDCDASTRPVSVREPHFNVFPEFEGASYVERYRLLLKRLMREQLYAATCLMTTPDQLGTTGDYGEPDPDLTFLHFLLSLQAQASTIAAMRETWVQRAP